MITNKKKITYINDTICMYELFKNEIKCHDLFIMTLKRIISLDNEKLIFEYYYNFKRECYKRYNKKEIY